MVLEERMGREELRDRQGGGMNRGLLGGTGGQSGEAGWGYVKGFILLLLRCNWHLTLYYFWMYKLTIRSLYLLRSDHHMKFSENQVTSH